MENKTRLVLIIVIGILLIGNVYFALNYFQERKDVAMLEASQAKTELNTKVIDFTSLFIKKVLQANSEVDFDTRLSLENAVRDLKDPEIMGLWQNFINSKTEAEAQNNVKALLGVLISKIQK